MQKKTLLITFIAVVLLKQLVWTALLPLWQTPDEQAHFAQVQNIAENNAYRYDEPNFKTTSLEIDISERILKTKRDAKGDNSFTYHPNFNIEYTDGLIGKKEQEINGQPLGNRKKLAIKEATGYPPLYYQFSATGYHLVYEAGFIDRVFFVRIWQGLIFLVTCLIYYFSAKLIFKNKIEALRFSIFISFLPMLSFVSAGITSDNLMNMLFAASIYLGLWILHRGVEVKTLILFLSLFILGVKTKPHFVLSLPIFFAAVLFDLVSKKKYWLVIFCLFAPLIFFGIFYSDRLSEFLVTRRVGSFFYETGAVGLRESMKANNIARYFLISIQKTYRETIPWFWGIFRWLSFSLDRWFYRTWNIITVFSVLTGLVFIGKKMKKSCGEDKGEIKLVTFLFFCVLIYFFGLTFWDFLFFSSHGYSFGIQGRYYFPVLFPIAFLIYNFFPVKKILPVVSVIFNFYALSRISASYYSIESLSKFIIQASQYKPWFFKNGNLVFLLILYVALLVIFLIKLKSNKYD